jgi:ABC-type oligopeptide transport system ATPase subunit
MSDRIAVMNQGKLVEVGTAEQVYHEPRDEYTKALFAAVPVPDPHRQRERKAERALLRKENRRLAAQAADSGLPDAAPDIPDPRSETGPVI